MFILQCSSCWQKSPNRPAHDPFSTQVLLAICHLIATTSQTSSLSCQRPSQQLTSILLKPLERVISPFLSPMVHQPLTFSFVTSCMHQRWASHSCQLASSMSLAMQHFSVINDAKFLMHERRVWARFHLPAGCIHSGCPMQQGGCLQG